MNISAKKSRNVQIADLCPRPRNSMFSNESLPFNSFHHILHHVLEMCTHHREMTPS